MKICTYLSDSMIFYFAILSILSYQFDIILWSLLILFQNTLYNHFFFTLPGCFLLSHYNLFLLHNTFYILWKNILSLFTLTLLSSNYSNYPYLTHDHFGTKAHSFLFSQILRKWRCQYIDLQNKRDENRPYQHNQQTPELQFALTMIRTSDEFAFDGGESET